ncbi:MAG: NAD(P)H-binding protein [Spirosomataceae bacterium]
MKPSPLPVAVIGGTGKAGTYLIRHLLDQGFEVRALYRNPTQAISHPLLRPIQGDASRYESISTLLEGCGAVISTLGSRKGEPVILSQATEHIIRAMNQLGLKRYIVVTGLSIDVPADRKRLKTRLLSRLMRWSFPKVIADKQREFQLLSESTLDWTVVRVPQLELSEELYPVRVSVEDCLGDKLSTTALAHFLVQQLSNLSLIHQAPFVSN